MDIIKDNLYETIIGGVMAMVPLFVRRTLSNYDRRILQSEKSHAEILKKLHKIDKELTRVATIIEMEHKHE